MKVYHGVMASPGVAVAPVRRLTRSTRGMSRLVDTPQVEIVRLRQAVRTAYAELEALSNAAINPENKDIFFFQCCLLEDEGLLEDAKMLIESGMGAASAMEKVAQQNADQLRALADNEYMQLRAADVLDACRRVVDILDRRPHRPAIFDHPLILAAESLLPSDLAAAPPGIILGVATAGGSPQSHAAIIARSLGVPSVVQLGQDFLAECDGRSAALDAAAGVITLDPPPALRQRLVGQICAAQSQQPQAGSLAATPCRTADGVPFRLEANCFGPEDIRTARQAGVSAIGLVRSEYLLMRGYVPGEEEQYRFYTDCLAAAGGLPVTIRTFDVGADRTTGSLAEPEENPELGLRGIRYSLADPACFEDQLCALLRAGCNGPLSVCLPMVGGTEDWQQVMQFVEHAKELLRRRGEAFDEDLPFGATLEIPAACLEAAALPPLGCRFFMIGLNDLVQYTHAADRNSYRIAPYYRTASPAILQLMRLCVQAARQADVPLSINGLPLENPALAVTVLQQGVRAFSLPVQRLLSVKRALLAAQACPPAPPQS